MKDLEEARKYFGSDNYAVSTTGIVIEAVDDNYARCSLKIDDCHLNAKKSVMGGAIFTLTDYVFAVATNSPDKHVVTTSSQITYLGTAKGDTLIAESQIIKAGRTMTSLLINVTDNLGNKIATAVTSGMKIS